MGKRINTDREQALNPKRMKYATDQLHLACIKSVLASSDKCLEFDFKGTEIGSCCVNIDIKENGGEITLTIGKK